MSDLTSLERRKLERLLQMGGGYVLKFSNTTLDEFFVESIGRSLYDKKYSHGSGSKANQMRGFWKEESNPIVARLLGALLDYVESERLSADDALMADCRKIVVRLKESNPVAEVEAIARIANEHDLDVVAKAVLDLIEKNELVAGLDRLHTLTTKYLRRLCETRGLVTDQGKPLHSLFGEYVRALHSAGHIQSKMTASILKALNQPLDSFNDVRNNQSLAHDNELLNHEEAILIFNHVTSALRFLRDLERRVQRREQAEAAKSVQPTATDEEIPF
jgi:hypothetical protein